MREGMGSGNGAPAIEWPALGVTRVPYEVFADAELYRLEQERIFRGRCWHFVGLELETPAPGDYRTNRIGDTPVIMVRAPDGTMSVLVNRCAHRGAMLCYDKAGHRESFACVYHNWCYDLDGNLTSVAFRHGIRGKGGLPGDFDLSRHGLRRLRVEALHGLVFATFSEEVEPLASWLGERMVGHFARIFHRPMRILGGYSQVMRNNWKLYIENVKDSYHASLLHLFFSTFRLNRLSMEGAVELGAGGGHHISWSKMATDESAGTDYEKGALRAMQDDLALADRRLLKGWPEYPDGITLAIQSVFPNFIVQQIQNSLAVRLMVPQGTEACELHWLLLGYADDTPEQVEIRLRQSNLVGPAGFISMEDGVIGSLIQRGVPGAAGEAAVLEMGGRTVESGGSRVSEAAVRGFWQVYRTLVGI